MRFPLALDNGLAMSLIITVFSGVVTGCAVQAAMPKGLRLAWSVAFALVGSFVGNTLLQLLGVYSLDFTGSIMAGGIGAGLVLFFVMRVKEIK